MKAKEKAKELLEKFRMYDIIITDPMLCELDGYADRHCKKCALISVDEIINSLSFRYVYQKDFWINVKTEIEKL